MERNHYDTDRPLGNPPPPYSPIDENPVARPFPDDDNYNNNSPRLTHNRPTSTRKSKTSFLKFPSLSFRPYTDDDDDDEEGDLESQASPLPPNLLVTPPSPISPKAPMESFLILDQVAWARETGLGPRSRRRDNRTRRMLVLVCKLAIGMVAVILMLAGAWGLVLWGLFGGDSGSGAIGNNRSGNIREGLGW